MNDFVIENGVLKKYAGTGEDVVIPDGVTEIGDWAFLNCRTLTEVTIPEGIVKIGANAFLDCKKLKTARIPNSVMIIGIKAFCGCDSLSSLSVPGGLKAVGMRAFETPALTALELRNGAVIVKDMFGALLPAGLVSSVTDLAPAMDDGAFRQYVLNPAVWSKLDFDTRCGFISKRGSKSLMSAYNSLISASEADEFGNCFLKLFSGEPSAAECASAGAFLVGFSKKLNDDVASKLQEAINNAKNGKKAATVAEKGLAEKRMKPEIDPSYSETAKKLLLRFTDEKTSADSLISGWNKKLKEVYSISFDELPKVIFSDGKTVEPFVFAYLLIENGEKAEGDGSHENGTPWYSQESAEIINSLDHDDFQHALITLADNNLGQPVKSKKMYLAYPICRFADEKTMAELSRRAPQWRSYTSGINAPSLLTFRRANRFNDSRAAMLFAEKCGELYSYAKLRNLDEDTVRDKYLSDFGLDAEGCKKFDLGNFTVTARMLPDFSFVIELPDSKMTKSLPKKGADSEKYEKANADFLEMKKSLKKTVKARNDRLFEMFLNGTSKTAIVWKSSYTGNPVLRKVAELIVWDQGGKTFTLTHNGPANSAGEPFVISDSLNIRVAHPSEMNAGDVVAWQRYFTFHSLKQPFEQIWEPMVDLASVKEDRYAGCLVPYYRFLHREKQGISVFDHDFHNEINIDFKDCTADVIRIDRQRHSISADDSFEIRDFRILRRTRMANHIVGYLDKCTVYGRILSNDITVVNILSGFTLAQISDFVKFSAENEKTAVTAALLAFKNEHFADFDPMEEFTLD